MRVLLSFLLISLSYVWAAEEFPLVNAKTSNFSLKLDIRYATKENPTKQAIYPEAKCLLLKPVAQSLARAMDKLKLQGFGLKVYDCYRSKSIEQELWKLLPDPRAVTPPGKSSAATRGAAVDVVLTDKYGEEIRMPSVYPTRLPPDAPRCGKKNRTKTTFQDCGVLEDAMKAQGFVPSATEWWHYEYSGWEKFPELDTAFSSVP